MKNSLSCFVFTIVLICAVPGWAQQASDAQSQSPAQVEASAETPDAAGAKRKKAFKASEVWKVVEKKRVPWWQIPKPPIPETRRYSGLSHAGH